MSLLLATVVHAGCTLCAPDSVTEPVGGTAAAEVCVPTTVVVAASLSAGLDCVLPAVAVVDVEVSSRAVLLLIVHVCVACAATVVSC